MPDAGAEILDLLVIGGGINGAGIARDAAGRGLRVMLVEQGDLASATSMASSKLIHGGLRYLEQGHLRLVRESLAEREVLLRTAAHLLTPLRFILPHSRALRPAWMLRAGLWMYDHLGGRSTLPGSESLSPLEELTGNTLKPEYRRGFAYSDCWVDDARLVLANALSAQEKGATIRTRTRCVALRPTEGQWIAGLSDDTQMRARMVVNAAGPWVAEVLHGALGARARGAVRLVKGSHIIVPRRHPGPHAFILQNEDRRVVFLLPFEKDFTLIGTTDVAVESTHQTPQVSADEIEYLCTAASRYLRLPVSPDEVVWSYSGVRALYDDGKANPSEVTRDYVLQLDRAESGAPLLSVFGGKITTYRKLAEHVMDKLRPVFPRLGRPWTHAEPLPGSDFHGETRFSHTTRLCAERPAIPPLWIESLVSRHGSRAEDVLDGARGAAELGTHFGAGLTSREVDFFVRSEWARDADDVLWRRSKAGLHLTAAQKMAVKTYVDRNR
jgi:glycerol-3-phosphate dehydrogenase